MFEKPATSAEIMSKLYTKYGKTSWWDRFMEWYRGSLMTSPTGYMGNMIGNLGEAAVRVSSNYVAEKLPVAGKERSRGRPALDS
jgi:hypothetical protein